MRLMSMRTSRSVVGLGLASVVLLTGCSGQAAVSGPATHESTAARGSIKGDVVLAAATSKPCLSVAPMPSHLPPGVSGRTTVCETARTPPVARPAGSKPIDAPGALVSSTQQVQREVTYTLAGSINADKTPRQWSHIDQGKLLAGGYHGRTDIVFVTWTHATTLDPLGAGDYIVQVMQPLSSGGTARVTTMSNGWGPVRVEWTSGGNTYLLLTTHSITDQGPTGVPVNELLAMANSVKG
jgi:hypothetical protein